MLEIHTQGFLYLNTFSFSDQEMGDTKVSIKGLHEDMRIFASEVTEESKSATDRVKKLGTHICANYVPY